MENKDNGIDARVRFPPPAILLKRATGGRGLGNGGKAGEAGW